LPDVRRDQIIGAVELGRHSLFVIRQGHAQRRHPETIEHFAEIEIRAGFRVPVRQYDDRRFFVLFVREKMRVNRIVFR
jgi:hypothetical protein